MLLYQKENNLPLVRIDAYLAWIDRLVIYFFWMALKNFRW